jgi:hypothetical protein
MTRLFCISAVLTLLAVGSTFSGCNNYKKKQANCYCPSLADITSAVGAAIGSSSSSSTVSVVTTVVVVCEPCEAREADPTIAVCDPLDCEKENCKLRSCDWRNWRNWRNGKCD